VFNWTGGHVSLLRVKVTCTDLVSFAFILHVFNHDWISFRCNYSLCVASAGFSCTVSMAVSSAKVAVVLLARVGRSAVKIRYSRGPSTLPCGTPARTGLRDE
jgi:hypothetical protein